MPLYVVNLTFGGENGGVEGEVVDADPAYIADWLDAGFVTEIDERGDRLVDPTIGGPDPAAPRSIG